MHSVLSIVGCYGLNQYTFHYLQVLQLMTEHDGNDDKEVDEMKAKVESLLESYGQVESSGHRELNHIRGIASMLEMNWTRFYSDMEQRHRNLHLSLQFQEILFEVTSLEITLINNYLPF